MQQQFYVYILTNRPRTLYIGVTNNIVRRMAEHRSGSSSFTARYQIDTLIHVEIFADVREAIAREKQLKGWSRTKKIALTEEKNPNWDALQAG